MITFEFPAELVFTVGGLMKDIELGGGISKYSQTVYGPPENMKIKVEIDVTDEEWKQILKERSNYLAHTWL